MSDYRLLCEDGTVQPLQDSANACTWFKQPWKVVVAREDKAAEVVRRLEETTKVTYTALSWQSSLSKVLLNGVEASIYKNETSVEHYLRSGGRELQRQASSWQCGEEIRWCTVSREETAKCRWTAAAAQGLGIRPSIGCVEARDNFDCFEKIAAGEASITSIDSTYGYLARKAYGLTALLFAESLESQYSLVVGAIRDAARHNRVDSWQAVRGRAVCFPEYGGISWLSFVKTAREQRLLAPNSCDYPRILADLLGAACAPGFSEASHFQAKLRPRLDSERKLNKLCSLCPSQTNGEQCEASPLNRYFGDKGALDCLRSGDGHVAFFEPRNLRAFVSNGTVNASDFRVLCKNGSLALHTGFEVDQDCALSVTIDSELVARRDLPTRPLLDTTAALLKIENWLGYRERKLLLVYGPFNRTQNLLFKDSTVALVASSSSSRAVQAYQDLFSHVDACSSADSGLGSLSLLSFSAVFALLARAAFEP